MKKIKYFLILAVSTLVAAGIYIFCIQSKDPRLLTIMPVYQLISMVGICVYLYLYYRGNNEIGKAQENGEAVDSEKIAKYRDGLKTYIAVVFPFVAVTICDYIYLLLLADNKIFGAILKFFG